MASTTETLMGHRRLFYIACLALLVGIAIGLQLGGPGAMVETGSDAAVAGAEQQSYAAPVAN